MVGLTEQDLALCVQALALPLAARLLLSSAFVQMTLPFLLGQSN